MILALVGFAVCAALGCLGVRALAPILFADPKLRPLGVVLGLALGLGFGSFTLFFTGLAFDGLSRAARLTELGLLLVAAMALAWRARRKPLPAAPTPPPLAPPPVRTLAWCLLGALLIAAVMDALWVVPVGAERPNGTWDAWAIWNTRARFFVRAEQDWTVAFRTPYGNPDYPLLLPLSVARFWAGLGGETSAVPRILAASALFAVLAAAASALAGCRGWVQGLMAALVLAGTRDLALAGVAQDAELLLALFLLLAVALLVLADRRPGSRQGLLVLAGACAGMAAWTKNEGWLQLVALFGALGLFCLRAGSRGRAWRDLCAFGAGALPAVAVALTFKLGWAPPGNLAAGQGLSETTGRLLDPLRYGVVARAMAHELFALGGAYLGIAAVWGAWLGWRPGGAATRAAALALAIVVAGYFAVYVVTPADLQWHLDTSARRVLLSLWPAAVLVFFAGASTVEEQLGTAPSGNAGAAT